MLLGCARAALWQPAEVPRVTSAYQPTRALLTAQAAKFPMYSQLGEYPLTSGETGQDNAIGQSKPMEQHGDLQTESEQHTIAGD
jgi:hypothetical protein